MNTVDVAGPIIVVGLIAAMCAVAFSIIRNNRAIAPASVASRPGWLSLPNHFTAGPHTWRDASRLRRLNGQVPYPYAGTLFLEPATAAYAVGLLSTMGRTINGGVTRSEHLRQILAPNVPLGPEPQEWIALEGGLALVDPMGDSALVIEWTDIASISALGLVDATDAAIGIGLTLPSGTVARLRLQANVVGMSNLYEIARSAGVHAE